MNLSKSALLFQLVLGLLFNSVAADSLNDIRELSSPQLEGRKTGTESAERARRYIVNRFKQIGLASINDDFQHHFVYGSHNKSGVNLIAFREGCRYPAQYIVITAHYDHLGKQGRKIYHGADDNASGVAAMLNIAEHLQANCPSYSFIFAATDAEESGLYGSKAFIQRPPVAKERIIFNLNLDMISRADRRGRLYLTGARQFPELIALLDKRFPKIQFLSHNGPSRVGRNASRHDWLNASDHGPFYRAQIPYLFFGGQDHPQYHTEDDQWQRIEPEFLQMALSAILATVEWVDNQTPEQLKK